LAWREDRRKKIEERSEERGASKECGKIVLVPIAPDNSRLLPITPGSRDGTGAIGSSE